jgi:hypothetical protein
MEFASRISAKDYRSALRLKRKNLYRIVYAAGVLDVALWAVFVFRSATGDIAGATSIFPQASILLVWASLMLMILPIQAHLGYRKNKNIQSEFNNSATEHGFSYKSSSGSSGEAPWSSFSFWRESRTVILLVFPSNIFLICPKSCLSVSQLEEFKGILEKLCRKNRHTRLEPLQQLAP